MGLDEGLRAIPLAEGNPLEHGQGYQAVQRILTPATYCVVLIETECRSTSKVVNSYGQRVLKCQVEREHLRSRYILRPSLA